MRIAQISDTHILAPGDDHPAQPARVENLRACIADINRQGVDVVIHTGDTTQNGAPEEYELLRALLSELDAPFFMVPGNRDRFAALRGIFPHLDYLPAEGDDFRYAVDGFPLRLIGLDSMLPDVRKGVFGADRISWLEEALGQAPDTPTLLFMHHPPFDVPQAGYTDGYRDAADAEALTGAVSRHRQVIRLICGHVHVLHGERWGNAIATTMPSVAVDVRKGVAPEIGDAPVYMLHEYSEDGELDSVMQVAGAARDA